ncbi:MAG TPA: coproporphyrinogen III oxidase, partial [bacterium]
TGFNNLNLDLMFGLSGQSLAMFQETLRKAVQLGPDHLSLYALQVEEGTPLSRQVREGLSLPSEDETADEYFWAQEFLTQEGFEQYEVSNFARPGKSCQHNWNIWRGEDYWGFGVGAVGTVKGRRFSHEEDLAEYIRKVSSGEDAPVQEERLPETIQEWEKLMLGLRTKDGVLKSDVERVAHQRGLTYEKKFDLFEKEGLLLSTGNRYRPTGRGYFVLNGILETLIA